MKPSKWQQSSTSRGKNHLSNDSQNDNKLNASRWNKPHLFQGHPNDHRQVAVVVGDVAIGEAIHQDAVEDLARVYAARYTNATTVIPSWFSILKHAKSSRNYSTLLLLKIYIYIYQKIPSHLTKESP